MRPHIAALCATSLIALAGLIAAQQPADQAPAPHISPTSGRDMYLTYCAACHGKDGKGGGPVAAALKTAPPDLTTLAKRNKGMFPSDRVYSAITGVSDIPAHGSKEMRIWGPLLLSRQHDPEVRLRVTNLTKYIGSIQEK